MNETNASERVIEHGRKCYLSRATFKLSNPKRWFLWRENGPLIALANSYLVYFHEFGVLLWPLDGHLDDVGRRRHGWGWVVLPDLCLFAVFSPLVCYLIQTCGREKKKSKAGLGWS